jgi:endonuclease/exonuclease/phosphatase family metal-dependent hydrolase
MVRAVPLLLTGLLLGCSGAGAQSASHQSLPEAPLASASRTPLRLSTNPNQLRVMTFNLRVPFLLDAWNYWVFRRGLVVSTIDKFAPDILGTQECPYSSAKYLRSKLTDYGFVGAGRDDGKRGGEMCGMFFRRDRFTKLDSGTFWLSDTPGVPGSKSWGNWSPRIVSWIKLQPKAGGSAFCWFNTHFDNGSTHSRIESAKLLRAKADAIAGGLPIVVTGDFNADCHGRAYEMLVGGRPGIDTDLFDAFRVTHPIVKDGEGTMHNFHGGRNGARIDWILTSKAFKPLDVEIDHTQVGPIFPSDHFPVEAVVSMTSAEPTHYANAD